MSDNGYKDFIRGEKGSTAEHLSDLEFKAKKEREKLEAITNKVKQQQAKFAENTSTIEESEKHISKVQQELNEIKRDIDNYKVYKGDIDSIDVGKSKLFGKKVELDTDDYQNLVKYAKKGIASDVEIKKLKEENSKLNHDFNELKEKAKDFIRAIAYAPTRVADFFKSLFKEEEQEKQSRLELAEKQRLEKLYTPAEIKILENLTDYDEEYLNRFTGETRERIEKGLIREYQKEQEYRGKGLNDFLPIQDWFNEMHAKNTSEKIKVVFTNKGNQGLPLTTIPPYGYIQDKDNKYKWLVDEPAAKVIRQIFKWCIDGYGTLQIARMLKQQHIMTPAEYAIATGCTVNFRSTTRSFKDHRKVNIPKEQWKIFENTHEPIIDENTFNIVQQIRDNKQRPTRTGRKSIFQGKVYCNDCKAKMYFCTFANKKTNWDIYRCSTYKNHYYSGKCTPHNIRDHLLQQLVLENLQRTLGYVKKFEHIFIYQQQQLETEQNIQDIKYKKDEIRKANARINELNLFFTHIYEDNVIGKLSDEKFRFLSAKYEKEENELKAKVEELTKYLQSCFSFSSCFPKLNPSLA